MSIAPEHNRARNQGLSHLWSKFSDPSLNGWWIIARTSSWLTDTQTHTHTQATTIPEGQNWPRVKTELLSIKYQTTYTHSVCKALLLLSTYMSSKTRVYHPINCCASNVSTAIYYSVLEPELKIASTADPSISIYCQHSHWMETFVFILKNCHLIFNLKDLRSAY